MTFVGGTWHNFDVIKKRIITFFCAFLARHRRSCSRTSQTPAFDNSSNKRRDITCFGETTWISNRVKFTTQCRCARRRESRKWEANYRHESHQKRDSASRSWTPKFPAIRRIVQHEWTRRWRPETHTKGKLLVFINFYSHAFDWLNQPGIFGCGTPPNLQYLWR